MAALPKPRSKAPLWSTSPPWTGGRGHSALTQPQAPWFLPHRVLCLPLEHKVAVLHTSCSGPVGWARPRWSRRFSLLPSHSGPHQPTLNLDAGKDEERVRQGD